MTYPRRLVLIGFAFLVYAGLAYAGDVTEIYKDPKAPLESRVEDLFKRLTLEEKLSLLKGNEFSIYAIPRLGVREAQMVDASLGVRGGDKRLCGPATQFTSGPMIASTWDTELAGRIAKAIGEEAKNKGIGAQILLGPGLNIHRSPLCGRDGEYYSEDPYLASRFAVSFVRGLQSTDVAACVKHFVCNNEEDDRGYVDVRVSERALREIYLPAFEAAIKEGGAWCVMSAYNKVNGQYMSANPYLLTQILKKGWGFDGMVMSDWGGVHQLVTDIHSGNDIEMPGELNTVPNLLDYLKHGILRQSAVDDSVHRILRTLIRVGAANPPITPDPKKINTPEHQKLAFEVASKGIVLLKNEGNLLPLDTSKVKTIVVIGRGADDVQIGPDGSPNVTPFYKIQPLDGIKQRVGNKIKVLYSSGEPEGELVPASVFTPTGDGLDHGLTGEYFDNRFFSGKPVYVGIDKKIDFEWNAKRLPWPKGRATDFSVRWSGKITAPQSGTYHFILNTDDRCRLFIDNKPVIDHADMGYQSWLSRFDASFNVGTINLTAGKSYNIRIEYIQADEEHPLAHLLWAPPANQNIYSQAVKMARKADVAIVCVSTKPMEIEARDRTSMALPFDQETLIREIAMANKKTIVVLNNGGAVTMSNWIDDVPSILETWFPGPEGGHALAGIIFGDINPSGKLPDTFGVRREDYPDYGHFHGVNGEVHYDEDIYVGYRYFDKKNITPLFPFGYGLSYTTFKYTNLRLSSPVMVSKSSEQISVDITNTGNRAGAEIVQLYIHDPNPKINKPIRELKGFARVELKPGETKTVHILLTPRDLAYCDVPGKQWKADAGTYEIQVGSSSRNILLHTDLNLKSDFHQPIPGMEEQKEVVDNFGPDLAQGRPVIASSSENNTVEASNVVDGDHTTRWGSQFSDPQWIAVDLQKPTTINRVRLEWEAAFARSYSLQVSNDGKEWKDVYSNSYGIGGDDLIQFSPVTTRWVRMYGAKRITKWGYSLFNFEVYGPKE